MSAQARGWGNPDAPNYRRDHIVKITAGGVTWYVRREIAPLIKHLVEKIVVPAIGPITKRADDWSYANRCIRGTGPGTGKPCRKSNHCLGGDTLVLTEDGLVPIRDLAGTSPRLLTRSPLRDGTLRGRWVEAPVRGYGRERVAVVRLARGGETREITASLPHRWFVTMPSKTGSHEVVERQTSELQTGDHLATCFVPPMRRVTPSVFGIMHGVVFGDGTRQPGGGTKVTLWGAKRDLLRYFPAESPMSPRSRDTGIEGIEVRGLPDGWKEPQPVDGSATHRAGFLAGLIATDGHVRAGEVRLSNRSRDVLDHIALLARSLGIETRKPRLQKESGSYGPGDQWSLAFIASTVPEWLLIRSDQHADFDFGRPERRPQEWRVVDVDDAGAEEDVYCATVDGTGAFTLDGQLLTGNSWGLAIDVNATQNAYGGSQHGQFPANFGQRVDDWGFRWGGDYRSIPDPMHLEFMGTPADAARLCARLKAPTKPTRPQKGDDVLVKQEDKPEVYQLVGDGRIHVTKAVYVAMGSPPVRVVKAGDPVLKLPIRKVVPA